MNPEEIIANLNLQPHPEGGYYRETYRAEEEIALADGKKRNTSTGIYYLLKDGDKSHLHRLSSDEIWLFHQGEPLEIVMIHEDGRYEIETLGNQLEQNEIPQVVIKANVWFGARLKSGKGYALVSCIVAPGFDFEDFEMGKKEELLREFPHLRKEIEEMSLTHPED